MKIKNPIVPKQIKLALIGDSGVGKSSLAYFSLEDDKSLPTEPTNLVDIVFKKVKLKDNTLINVL